MSVFRSKFFQAVLILVIVFLLFRFGIRPAAPWSVFTLYMFVALIAVLVYVSSNGDSWRSFVAPIRATVLDDSKRPIRLVLAVLLPLLFGYYAYTQAAAGIQAPAEVRALPPPPPAAAPSRQPAPGDLPRPGDHRDAPGGVSLLANRQGRAGPAEGVHALELGYARLGGPAERGRYLEGHHAPLRRDGLPPPPLGDPRP